MAEITKGENGPGILVPALEGGNAPVYPYRAIAPSNVHSAPPGKASHTAARTAASALSSDWSGC